MRNRLLVSSILLIQSSLMFSLATTRKIKLSFIKEIDTDFISIVDSLINQEKKCDYYTDSLFFCISINEYPERSDSLYIEIESCKDRIVVLNLNPIAFFKRHNHFFYIYDTIPTRLFSSVDDPVELSCEHTEEMNDIIISDDSYSHWIYLFYNNRFSLLSTFSWCN